jgi:biopolymer transport protein ExbB
MKKPLLLALAMGSGPAAFAQDSGKTPAAAVMSLWQVLMTGGPVMIVLGALSVLTITLILVCLFTLTRRSVVTGRYMQTADALLRKGDYLGLLAVSNRHGEAVAKVMQHTLDFLTKHPRATAANIREIAQTEGVRQASAMHQRVSYLADIATLAPMVGLFGTALGMIKSFTAFSGDFAATRPVMLAAGVSEALLNTAGGLLIGIPAMAAYAFFRGRLNGLTGDLEAATARLLVLLSTQYKSGSATDFQNLEK